MAQDTPLSHFTACKNSNTYMKMIFEGYFICSTRVQDTPTLQSFQQGIMLHRNERML